MYANWHCTSAPALIMKRRERMKKAQLTSAVLVVLALLLSACQQPAASTATSAPPAPTQATGGLSANENEPSTGNENTSTGPGESEPLELSSVSEGLASLNSYTILFTMSFEGTKDGQPDTWTWTMEETFRKDPPAKRVVMSGSGSTAEA